MPSLSGRAWIARLCDARCDDVVLHGGLLCLGVPVRQGMPEVEVRKMDVITVVALVLSVLLLGYLTVSLLYPEKF
jgi:K+-transporting ATPase KdpF subunit